MTSINTATEHSAPRRAAPLLFLTTLLFWFCTYTYSANFAVYLGTLGAGSVMVGIVIGSYGFTQLVLRIPFGMISDRLGARKPVITLGIAATTLASLLLFVTHNIPLTLIARLLSGVGSSAWACFNVLYSSYLPQNKSTSAVSRMLFFSDSGTLLAVVAGAFMVQYFDYQAPFLLSIVTGGAAIILSLFLYERRSKRPERIEKRPTPESGTLRNFTKALTDRTLWAVSLTGLAIQFVIFATVYSFTPIFAKEHMSSAPYMLGILTASVLLFSACTEFIISIILRRERAESKRKRFSERHLAAAGMTLIGLSTVCVPFTTTIGALIATQMVFGLGMGMSFPLLMGLSIKHLPESLRGTAMGAFQAIYALGMTVGPVVTGALSDSLGLRAAFIAVGAFCLAVCAASAVVLRKLKL